MLLLKFYHLNYSDCHLRQCTVAQKYTKILLFYWILQLNNVFLSFSISYFPSYSFLFALSLLIFFFSCPPLLANPLPLINHWPISSSTRHRPKPQATTLLFSFSFFFLSSSTPSHLSVSSSQIGLLLALMVGLLLLWWKSGCCWGGFVVLVVVVVVMFFFILFLF